MNQREHMYIEFLETLKDGRNDAVVESIAGKFQQCVMEGWSPSVSSMAYNQQSPDTWGSQRGHYSGSAGTDTAPDTQASNEQQNAHTEPEVSTKPSHAPSDKMLASYLNRMLPTIQKVANANPAVLEKFSEEVQKMVTSGYNNANARNDRSDITGKSSDVGNRKGLFNRVRRGFSGLTKGFTGESDARLYNPTFENDNGNSLNLDNGSLDIDASINRVKTPGELSVDSKLDDIIRMIDSIFNDPGLKPSEHARLKEFIIGKVNSCI